MNTEEKTITKDYTDIAVYGTLRQQYGNHGLIKGYDQVGIGWTDNKYQLTASGIPFVHPEKPVSKIRVEVYRIPNSYMNRVDGLEGHPRWYRRVPTPITLDNGEKIEAELYFNTQEGSTLIESGDYEDYRKLK